jgi:hypothetical protein
MHSMAASVAIGDRVIPATLLGAAATPLVASLAGGILAQPPHVGYVFDVDGTDADVLWDTGEVALDLPADDAGICSILRLAASSVVATWVGRVVQLIGGSPEFCGVVLFIASIEADPLTPSSLVDFVVVKSTGPSQVYWAAPITSISLASGR